MILFQGEEGRGSLNIHTNRTAGNKTGCFITLIREIATLTDTMIQQTFTVFILYSSILDIMVIKKIKLEMNFAFQVKKR